MNNQLEHIKKLIKAANELGIKTYVAKSNVDLWEDKKYDEFFKIE
jgi:hypothetical protein